jgi:hypothetical protein
MIKAEIRNPVYRHHGCGQSERIRLRLIVLSPDISMPRKKKNGYRSMRSRCKLCVSIRIGAAVSLHGARSFN